MRMKKSLFFGCYIVILLVLSLLICKQLRAQTLPAGALLVWPANPPAEQVEWYVVSVFDGNRDQWVKITDTSFCQTDQELRDTYPAVEFTESLTDNVCSHAFALTNDALGIIGQIRNGTELCFNVVAAKSGQFSEPSDDVCATVTAVIDTTTPTPGASSLSQPGTGLIFFRN